VARPFHQLASLDTMRDDTPLRLPGHDGIDSDAAFALRTFDLRLADEMVPGTMPWAGEPLNDLQHSLAALADSLDRRPQSQVLSQVIDRATEEVAAADVNRKVEAFLREP
jgi:hypothetical protein